MVSVETSSKFPSWCNCPLESKWCTELRILVAVDSGNLKQSLDEIVTAACSIDSSCFLLCSERSTFRLGTGRMFASHIFASSHEVLVVRAFPQHSCHFVWKCLHLGFRWCQRSFGSGTSQTWSTRSRCGGTHSIATVWTGEAPPPRSLQVSTIPWPWLLPGSCWFGAQMNEVNSDMGPLVIPQCFSQQFWRHNDVSAEFQSRFFQYCVVHNGHGYAATWSAFLTKMEV